MSDYSYSVCNYLRNVEFSCIVIIPFRFYWSGRVYIVSSIFGNPYETYILHNVLTLLIGSGIGIRDKVSAITLSRPLIYSMVNWNWDKKSSHRAFRLETFALDYIYVNATWSVKIRNFKPIKKCLHLSRHCLIATYSRSVAE